MPTIISGISLLIPFPKLAAYSCVWRIHEISRKLEEIATMNIQAFCIPDYAELYILEAETISAECEALLAVLPQLVTHVQYEVTMHCAYLKRFD